MAWDDEDLSPGEIAMAKARQPVQSWVAANSGSAFNVQLSAAQPWANTVYTSASSLT